MGYMKGFSDEELKVRKDLIMGLIEDIEKNPQIPEEDIKQHVIESLKHDEGGIVGAELIIKTSQVMQIIKQYFNPVVLTKEDVESKVEDILKRKSGDKFKIINKHGCVVASLGFDNKEQVDDYIHNVGGYDGCYVVEDIFGVFDR